VDQYNTIFHAKHLVDNEIFSIFISINLNPMKRFKSYTQNQLTIFPLDLGQLIGENHLVRVISNFVDQLSIDTLISPFEKEGW